jgi:hypothetical protein
MTPLRIDPATFQFVVQCLKHCATARPYIQCVYAKLEQKFSDPYINYFYAKFIAIFTERCVETSVHMRILILLFVKYNFSACGSVCFAS